MTDTEIVTFEQALAAAGPTERSTLLLGNGFSIACDPRFLYGSLYVELEDKGISRELRALFSRLGTNDFEGVLRLLDDAQRVAELYGGALPESVEEDREVLKQSLVELVSEHHPDVAATIDDARWTRARRFLSRFGSVFTTNYDLLLHWACLHQGTPLLSDGFGAHPAADDRDDLCFTFNFPERARKMWYLHGALHLYEEDGLVFKRASKRGAAVTEQVRDAIDDAQYPLFVAEGDPDRKAERIRRNGYLNAAREALSAASDSLIAFGFKFGATDQHLVDAIASNTNLRHLCVGLYGATRNVSSLETMTAISRALDTHNRTSNLAVTYFDSTTANVWDAA